MSNMLFDARVAELLAKRGHTVTLYVPQYNPSVSYTTVEKNVKIHLLNVTHPDEYAKLDNFNKEHTWHDMSLMDAEMREAYQQFGKILSDGCRGLLGVLF
jgi:hypothetical protein